MRRIPYALMALVCGLTFLAISQIPVERATHELGDPPSLQVPLTVGLMAGARGWRPIERPV